MRSYTGNRAFIFILGLNNLPSPENMVSCMTAYGIPVYRSLYDFALEDKADMCRSIYKVAYTHTTVLYCIMPMHICSASFERVIDSQSPVAHSPNN